MDNLDNAERPAKNEPNQQDYNSIRKESLFGFTYKSNLTGKPQQEDYLPVLKLLAQKGTVMDFSFEHDSKKRLHIHGIIKFNRRNPLFRSMIPYGFHSHFEPIYNIEGWRKYITKDDHAYFQENYAFNL